MIEGRDIGVIVAPHAELKIWLYADPEVRAARRHAERDGIEVEVLADEMRRRDERDAAQHPPAPTTRSRSTRRSSASIR